MIIGVFLPLTVQASAKSVSTATKSIDADIPSLDDDTVNIFVDMLYDRNSELYQEVMDVLKQKKEGTYEIFADIYSKIYSVYGLATTDDLIYFSVENAVMNTMNISSTLDLIKGAVDMFVNGIANLILLMVKSNILTTVLKDISFVAYTLCCVSYFKYFI